MSLRTISMWFVFFLSPMFLMGQTEKEIPLRDCEPKWGPDSTETLDNISLYRSYFKNEQYEDALPFWRYVYLNAPGAMERTHIDGIKLMEYQIKQNPSNKEQYVDTLFRIYDQRIKCFNDRGNVLSRKGLRLYKYRPGQTQKTLATFDTAVALEGNKTGYYILPAYFATTIKAYQKESISKKQALKRYQKILSIINHHASNQTRYASQYQSSKEKIDGFLENVNLIEKCADAKSIYIEQYKENPNDSLLWKKMFGLMKDANCENDSTYIKITEKLSKTFDNPDYSYKLAQIKQTSGKYSEAAEALKRAAEQTDDQQDKAEHYYELAQLYYQELKNFPKARKYALKAADLKVWGDPYILIGDLYASSGDLCGKGTGFKSQTVIWAAMDMYQKAKSVDPMIQSKANQKIANYQEYLPTKEDVFMRDLEDGDTYKIECWINRETTVRVREGEG